MLSDDGDRLSSLIQICDNLLSDFKIWHIFQTKVMCNIKQNKNRIIDVIGAEQ